MYEVSSSVSLVIGQWAGLPEISAWFVLGSVFLGVKWSGHDLKHFSIQWQRLRKIGAHSGAGLPFLYQFQSWTCAHCVVCSCGRAVRSGLSAPKNSTECPAARRSPYSNGNRPAEQSAKGQKSALLHIRYGKVMRQPLEWKKRTRNCRKRFLSPNNKHMGF
jgi:hypothetical protein